MGVVWLASDELLRRDVAIKEAIRPPGFDEDAWRVLRQRSLYEAQAAARLHHPNIASVYDVISHDDRTWIVMQLVPYPSLREVLKSDGPVSALRAAEIGLCVLAAMRAAFAAGILHRDIKPANILVGPDGHVVLTDFGLATADTGAHLTLTGAIVGSPAYMSPERARGAPATLASDLWSLGATLYAAVEGREPFARDSVMATLTAVVADEPDAPDRSGPLWPVISALLRKDPRARLRPDDTERGLAGAASMLAGTASLLAAPGLTGPATTALDAVALGPDNPGPAGQPADYPGRRPSRRRTSGWLMAGLASIVLITAIMLTAAFAHGDLPGTPANTSRVGGTPASQAHTTGPARQPGQRLTGANSPRQTPSAGARTQSPRTAPAHATHHAPPGQAKPKHQGPKPKKKPKGN